MPVGGNVVEPVRSRRKGNAAAGDSDPPPVKPPSLTIPLREWMPLGEAHFFPANDTGNSMLVRLLTSFPPSSDQQPTAALIKGICNTSNWCFVGALMQALVHCPPFVHLTLLVANGVPPALQQKQCPVTSCLGKWMATQYWRSSSTTTAAAVTAPRFPPMLLVNGTKLDSGIINQQDAHEFLVVLLQAISRECHELKLYVADPKAPASQAPAPTAPVVAPAEKGWTVVGRGKEKLTVREYKDPAAMDGRVEASAGISPQMNPISWIFGGLLHSHVKGGRTTKRGVTSVTIEPFLLLPVDIGFSPKCTLEEALGRVFLKESVDVSTGPQDATGPLAKSLRLGWPLPRVLIVHIRRYATTREGEVVKLDNTVEFRSRLDIPRHWCDLVGGSVAPTSSSSNSSGAVGSYALSSVVCHRGASANSGHYVNYLKGTSGGWMLVNDHRVTAASLHEAVLDAPYLLFFERQRPAM